MAQLHQVSIPTMIACGLLTPGQLQFEEGDGNGGFEESRGNMLSQLPTPVVVFHQCVPKGMSTSITWQASIEQH